MGQQPKIGRIQLQRLPNRDDETSFRRREKEGWRNTAGTRRNGPFELSDKFPVAGVQEYGDQSKWIRRRRLPPLRGVGRVM
jgi:hypothetical protein